MKKSIVVVAAIIIVGAVVGFVVIGKLGTASGSKWTQEAIEKDPDGYAKFLEKDFKGKIESFEAQRKDISSANAKLQRDIEKRQSDLEKSAPIFDELLSALDKGEFPVKIYGAEYGEQELRSQINVVMHEQESARKAIVNFTYLRNQGNKKQEILIGRITESKDQLATLDAKRNLFKARRMTDELSVLIADMNRAFDENEKVAASNPVGSLKDLIARAETATSVVDDTTGESVDAALEAYRAKKQEALLQEADEDELVTVENAEEEGEEKAKETAKVEDETEEAVKEGDKGVIDKEPADEEEEFESVDDEDVIDDEAVGAEKEVDAVDNEDALDEEPVDAEEDVGDKDDEVVLDENF